MSTKPSLAVIRIRAVKRLFMWHFLASRLPIYLVSEFPRSGGTWFGQMLAEYLRLPFPRNTTRPKLESCVLHGHHLYSPRFQNVVCVIRDGRDALVSLYYQLLFEDEWNNPSIVLRNRRTFGFDDLDDIRTNLPRFIDHMFDPARGTHPRVDWAEFVRSWIDRDVPIVRYEDLLVSPGNAMAPVIERLTRTPVDRARLAEAVDKFSFSKVTRDRAGRDPKHSFVRKGVAGDWRNHFSDEARQRFERHAGAELIRCGYEPSSDWARS